MPTRCSVLNAGPDVTRLEGEPDSEDKGIAVVDGLTGLNRSSEWAKGANSTRPMQGTRPQVTNVRPLCRLFKGPRRPWKWTTGFDSPAVNVPCPAVAHSCRMLS